MVGLIGLEVYNSTFNINTTNIQFELYTDTFDEFSFTELKDELEEILMFSILTHEHLQDAMIGPRIISARKKTRNRTENRDRLMVITIYYCVLLHQLFEILKDTLEW